MDLVLGCVGEPKVPKKSVSCWLSGWPRLAAGDAMLAGDGA